MFAACISLFTFARYCMHTFWHVWLAGEPSTVAVAIIGCACQAQIVAPVFARQYLKALQLLHMHSFYAQLSELRVVHHIHPCGFAAPRQMINITPLLA